MPINALFKTMHIRSKTNQNVMQNIDRLYSISNKSESAQELLDALHHWKANTDLYFHNAIPVIIGLFGIITLIISFFLSTYIPISFGIICSVLCIFISYLLYEPHKAIDDVIHHLEMRMKLLRFDIHYNQVPKIIATPSSPINLLNRLQLHFPLFNLGNHSNEFEHYAASTWQCRNGHTYPVLLFKYHYSSEQFTPSGKIKTDNLKVSHFNLWGAFVFNIPPHGFAMTNKRDSFFKPYNYNWKTSDIHLNKIIKIFGADQKEMAKKISPQLTLKLEPLFLNNEAELISHHTEHLVCYISKKNIFSVTSNRSKQNIRNISDLRGYLRTIDMPNYTAFQTQLLDVLTLMK